MYYKSTMRRIIIETRALRYSVRIWARIVVNIKAHDKLHYSSRRNFSGIDFRESGLTPRSWARRKLVRLHSCLWRLSLVSGQFMSFIYRNCQDYTSLYMSEPPSWVEHLSPLVKNRGDHSSSIKMPQTGLTKSSHRLFSFALDFCSLSRVLFSLHYLSTLFAYSQNHHMFVLDMVIAGWLFVNILRPVRLWNGDANSGQPS